MCDEYDQRIELIEKEKQYANQRIEQKESEIKKLLTETKVNETDIQNVKRSF